MKIVNINDKKTSLRLTLKHETNRFKSNSKTPKTKIQRLKPKTQNAYNQNIYYNEVSKHKHKKIRIRL
jgi:hypothetical protein